MNKITIDGVRAYYRLPDDISDDQIKSDLKGSLGEAVVNLNIATDGLKKAFIDTLPIAIKKHFGR